MNFNHTSLEQKAVCAKYNADFFESLPNLKVGIARNVKEKVFPINGLRVQPEADETGWYIWAGEELSQNPAFFVPLHVEHLDDWAPNIKKYLGLPPGWRFLVTDDHEDVWFDPDLLQSL